MTEEERPTKHEMFLTVAGVVSLRGTCRRLQVGCIITNEDGTQIVSMGYNGNARGLNNRCDTEIAGLCGCIHAEENALIKAPYDKGPLTMYTTHSPCIQCAKRILNSRITKVFYTTAYRDLSGIHLLSSQGVHVGFDSTIAGSTDLAARAALRLFEREMSGRDMVVTAVVGDVEARFTRTWPDRGRANS